MPINWGFRKITRESFSICIWYKLLKLGVGEFGCLWTARDDKMNKQSEVFFIKTLDAFSEEVDYGQ